VPEGDWGVAKAPREEAAGAMEEEAGEEEEGAAGPLLG